MSSEKNTKFSEFIRNATPEEEAKALEGTEATWFGDDASLLAGNGAQLCEEGYD